MTTAIPISTAYAHHCSGKFMINSPIRWAIIFQVFFIFSGISLTLSAKVDSGVSVIAGILFVCIDFALLLLILFFEFSFRRAAISSMVISSEEASSSSVSDLPPLMTLNPQPSEPCRGVPPANAIPIGSTARNTLIIPVIIIRLKYSLFRKRGQKPTAIPIQQSPAIIVP